MTNNNYASGAAKQPCTRRAKTTADAAPALPPTKAASKSDIVIKLLLRAKGATPMELIAATDWQPHSLRAFLSCMRKKGRQIVRETRKNGDAVYRIVAAAPETAAAAAADETPPGDVDAAANRAVDGGADA